MCATPRNIAAWVTFTSSETYLPGVFAVFGSLLRFDAFRNADFVLVTTCEINLQLTTWLRSRNIIIIVDKTSHTRSPNSSVSSQRLAKISVFKALNHYEKIIYVDADIHFLNDPSALLSLKASEFSAVQGQSPGSFNSGLFIANADSFPWDRFNSTLDDLTKCEGTGCRKYVDRMSKSSDDQGFLNILFRGRWTKLPEVYNTKAMYHLKGIRWTLETRPMPFHRKNTVGLHWIGRDKPWKSNVCFPCGNTKKYCSCSNTETRVYLAILKRWSDDFVIGFGASVSDEYNFDVINEFFSLGRYTSNISTLLKQHLLTRRKVCGPLAVMQAHIQYPPI